jgi:import inner membrane translocase subunit TIM44
VVWKSLEESYDVGWPERDDAEKDGTAEKRQPSAHTVTAPKSLIYHWRRSLSEFIFHSCVRKKMRPTTTFARASGTIKHASATSSSTCGRAAAYRRISTTSTAWRSPPAITSSSKLSSSSPLPFLRSEFLPQDIVFRTSAAYARQFSSRSALYEQTQKPKSVKEDEPVSEASAKKPPTEGTASEQAAGEQTKEGEEAKQKKTEEEEAGEQKEGEDGKQKEKEKKQAAPPPPHGDKTPWQVFTDTLKQEFQASKEWNEGTKELSGSIHDFTQNPQVQKAKQLSDEAKTKTAEALKATGRAVGQGAAWTWDTMPVKGVRAAARVTGTGLEYATRPVRQTKAFQAVKETIDDGSSSRYGGWVEKEERRKRRELRELNELQRTGGKPTGPMEEDPEYDSLMV